VRAQQQQPCVPAATRDACVCRYVVAKALHDGVIDGKVRACVVVCSA